MEKYKIFPLDLGTLKRPRRNYSYGSTDDTIIDVPMLAFYLESDKHRYLVDCGGPVPEKIPSWTSYTQTKEQTLECALARFNVTPDMIDAVFITHLHVDHCARLELFRGKPIYVHRAEYDHLVRIDGEKGYDMEMALAPAYCLVDGESDIPLADGIKGYFTPGHSVGSMSISVETEKGLYVLAADLIPVLANVEGSELIPTTNVINPEDMKTVVESMKKVVSLGGQVVPGHDSRVFELLQSSFA